MREHARAPPSPSTLCAVAVAARGVACGGLAEVEEMAEGEALGAVLDRCMAGTHRDWCSAQLPAATESEI
eukprot:scaffold6945_cov73-Phaeocystis_antarctica.AAC.1